MSKNSTSKPSALYRVAKTIVKPLAGLLFFPKYIGTDNIPEKKSFVICCNHISMFDPVFLCLGSSRQLFFMAKKELFSIPVLSSVLLKIGAFPVDRKRCDTEAIRKSMAVLGQGNALGIFPEGTRSKNGKMDQFKMGAVMIAARQQVPIVPAAIYVKGGRLKLFSRPVIVYGKPLTPKRLDISGKPTSAQQRAATQTLAERIQVLSNNAERSLAL